MCICVRVCASVCRERSGEFNLTSHPSCAQELANNLALCANMTCSVITHQLVIYDARACVHMHTLIIANFSLGARAVCNMYLILASQRERARAEYCSKLSEREKDRGHAASFIMQIYHTLPLSSGVRNKSR